MNRVKRIAKGLIDGTAKYGSKVRAVLTVVVFVGTVGAALKTGVDWDAPLVVMVPMVFQVIAGFTKKGDS